MAELENNKCVIINLSENTTTSYIKHNIYYKLDNSKFTNSCYEPKFAIKVDNNMLDGIINKDEYNRLMNSKNKIDKYYDIKQWDKMKKILNPYELIYITNKRNRKQSVSNYEPLSRSYYKMLEIAKEFLKDNINKDKTSQLISCHLAEGPGGFVEALLNKRKNKKDILYGMTLIDNQREVPGWKRIRKLLDKNPNIKLLNGIDGTGNLYNPQNHVFIAANIIRKCDLVTADGGFDFSVDYNLQEFLAQKLIFSEVICALSIQKLGGNFVCKFFDINSLISIEILYILSIYYENVYIFKPLTSRPANSEKYIVCIGFKSISMSVIEQLRNVLNLWNIVDNKKKSYITSIISNIDDEFKNNIIAINKKIINEQIMSIDKTIKVIEKPFNNEEYILNNKLQIKCSEEWVKKYDIKKS